MWTKQYMRSPLYRLIAGGSCNCIDVNSVSPDLSLNFQTSLKKDPTSKIKLPSVFLRIHI